MIRGFRRLPVCIFGAESAFKKNQNAKTPLALGEMKNIFQIASGALLGPPRGRKKSLETFTGALGETSNEISSNKNLAIMEREARSEREPQARQAEQEREERSKQCKRRRRRRTNNKDHHERDSKSIELASPLSPVASRRRCAPPPRRFELGALRELSYSFPAAFRLDPGEALGKM